MTHDWFGICAEIARRCIDPRSGRVTVPKRENKLAEEVCKWCEEQGWEEPAVSEMREAVILAPTSVLTIATRANCASVRASMRPNV